MLLWPDGVLQVGGPGPVPDTAVHRGTAVPGKSLGPGAGIMEADDGQVMTVFTVLLSFHHPHSTNRVS